MAHRNLKQLKIRVNAKLKVILYKMSVSSSKGVEGSYTCTYMNLCIYHNESIQIEVKSVHVP